MFVLAVVNRMDQFMHKGVEHFNRLMQCGGYEYLVLTIGAAPLGPALTHMVAS